MGAWGGGSPPLPPSMDIYGGSTATTIVGRGRGRSTQNEMQNGLVWGWCAAAMGKKEWAGVGSRQD